MKRNHLSDWIQVDRSVARSVNIERDAKDKSLLERYQVTSMVCKALERFLDALDGERVNAWSLTGAYGTGKSSFCHFLLSISCGNLEIRSLCIKKIQESNTELGQRLERILSLNKGMFPAIEMRAVSRYEPLNKTLARALIQALGTLKNEGKYPSLEKLYKQVEKLVEKEWPPTNILIRYISELTKILNKPVFIVVDELGKNLEYQSHRPDQGDIYILQALAEMKDVFLWVCLHQAFSLYSTSLTRIQREEWQKIQGRFEDISYVEPPARSFALIKDAISCEVPENAQKNELNKWADSIKKSIENIPIQDFVNLDKQEIIKIFPFHPLTAYLLGEMSRQFGQNDRTVFSFLSSGEPHAFHSFLQRSEFLDKERLPTISLDILYDYFCANGAISSNRTKNQRLLEVQYLIASRADKDSSEQRLLKSIGVLNLLSGLPGIVASKKVIHLALATEYYKTKKEINELLQRLVEQKVLLYREYADEFRLWEGSDFDLDKEILEIKGRISLQSVSNILEKTVPQEPLIASRHSVQKGTIRQFNVNWSTEEDFSKIIENPSSNISDGMLLLIVGRNEPTGKIIESTSLKKPLIIAFSPCYEQVRQLLIDAAASKEVCFSPELERDGVARREAKFRAQLAVEGLQLFIQKAFSPNNQTVKWFALGRTEKVSNRRELSKLLSEVCDTVYHECPPIKNEMLNCNKLSNAASAARNRVAEAMAKNPMSKNLGFNGWGPEVAIYRSVIKNAGLHIGRESGKWELSPPNPQKEPELNFFWEEMDRVLAEADKKGDMVSVNSLLNIFQKPPFGLRQGPLMLFIAHYILTNSDEVALYENNIFKPFLGEAEILLLLRRPELFLLRSYKPTGLRSQVIRNYSQVVNTNLDMSQTIRNQTILSIVAPLTEFIRNLPSYTKSTRKLSANALRLRSAITNSSDPQKLLYVEIPEALGLQTVKEKERGLRKTFETERFQKTLWQTLVELRDAFEQFRGRIKGSFINAFITDQDDALPLKLIRNKIRLKALEVIDVCFDPVFKKILLITASQEFDDETWLYKVAAKIMKKRVEHWEDKDFDEWTFRTKDLKNRLNYLYELKKLVNEDLPIEPSVGIISMAKPGGKSLKKILTLSKQSEELSKEDKELLSSFDKEQRIKYLSYLIKIMEDEGDFE